jgi:hypothetical protein
MAPKKQATPVKGKATGAGTGGHVLARGLLRRFDGAYVVALSAGASLALASYGPSSALRGAAAMCGVNAAMCLVLSLLTGDFSWVDRLWSVVPAFYALHFAAASGWEARTATMATLTSLWGLRLSYNFARKDGYQVRRGREGENLGKAVLFPDRGF